jgi:GntR family transcriptional regulator
LLSSEEAGLLAEQEPAACLSVERIVYDDTGQFVEFGRHVYSPSHYSIQTSLAV